MPMTVEHAIRSGWGERAPQFTAWYNKVEFAFRERTSIDMDFVFGDWRSADYFVEYGDDIDAVVEQLIEDATDEHGSLFSDLL